MSRISDRCTCPEPKPTEGREDQYDTFFGVIAWTRGVIYMVCMKCGGVIGEKIKAFDEGE